MNWLGFSLLALGLWGVWGFLGKVASQHLPSQQVYLLAISGHLVVAGYLWVGGLGAASWQPWGVGAALGAGLAMAVGLLCFFEALARGPATVVVPLTALYPAVTVVLSRVFLQEALTLRTSRPWPGVAAVGCRPIVCWPGRLRRILFLNLKFPVK
jgi:transporter family protein